MRKVREGTVRRLGRQILTAEDRGELDLYLRRLKQMVDIASVQSPEVTPEASLAAFRWIAAHDGGLLNDFVRQYLWAHPELVVEMVKAMRSFADCPTTRPSARRKALEALARYDYDDESLSHDDVDHGPLWRRQHR